MKKNAQWCHPLLVFISQTIQIQRAVLSEEQLRTVLNTPKSKHDTIGQEPADAVCYV